VCAYRQLICPLPSRRPRISATCGAAAPSAPAVRASSVRGRSLTHRCTGHRGARDACVTPRRRCRCPRPAQSSFAHRARSRDAAAPMDASNVPSSLTTPDAGVAALAASAGSASALSRGHWIAVGTLSVVMVGALGAGFRPIIRRAFAGAAARQSAVESGARAARIVAALDDPVLGAKLARLAALERAHRERHPWLYFDDAAPAASGSDAGSARAFVGAGGGGVGGDDVSKEALR
jgi:hypothetical protein